MLRALSARSEAEGRACPASSPADVLKDIISFIRFYMQLDRARQFLKADTGPPDMEALARTVPPSVLQCAPVEDAVLL